MLQRFFLFKNVQHLPKTAQKFKINHTFAMLIRRLIINLHIVCKFDDHRYQSRAALTRL